MVQAQKGYFKENGQFISENLIIKIPANRQVTIIWEEEPKEAQIQAAQNFLTAMQKIRKELTAEDNAAIDGLQNGKYKPGFEDRSKEL